MLLPAALLLALVAAAAGNVDLAELQGAVVASSATPTRGAVEPNGALHTHKSACAQHRTLSDP